MAWPLTLPRRQGRVSQDGFEALAHVPAQEAEPEATLSQIRLELF
jgi:hypothetical protein